MRIKRTKGRVGRWALRRAALGAAIPAAVLLAVRLLWGWEAERRLAGARAELRREGIRMEAPPRRDVPDEQNAALAVTDAVRAVTLSSSEQQLVNEGDGTGAFVEITWTDAHLEEMRAILARQAPVFHALETATQRPATSWPFSARECYKSGVGYYKDHPIFHARQLVNLLCDAAFLAHFAHDDAAALKYLQELLLLADMVDQDPAAISHIVAVAFRAVAAQAVERIAPDLRLRPGDGGAEAARRLLALLQEVPRAREALSRAWELETLFITPEDFKPGMPAFWQWWFAPLLADEMARGLRITAAEVSSLRADNWADTYRLVPKHTLSLDHFLDLATQYDSQNVSSSWKYGELHYRALADCAAAALLLAGTLYQQQNGHYPAAAGDLVPAYLPEVPCDPFAGDHRAMAYRLDPEGPTVWSVGENGTDEGGHVLLDADGVRRPRYGGSSVPEKNPPDIVYGAAWTHAPASPPPAPPSPAFPSTEPAEGPPQ